MTNHRRVITTEFLAILVLSLAGIGMVNVPDVHAISWNPAAQIPPNTCIFRIQIVNCIDTWSYTSQDQLGRVWLAWEGRPQGVVGARANIYYKLWTSGTWGLKVQITSNSNVTQHETPSITSLSNGTMFVVWSSNNTGTFQLYYRLYSGLSTPPLPTSGEVRLTTNSLNDSQPSAVQDRNGRIWVVWNRNNDTFYKYFNTTSWSSDFPVPPASSSTDSQYDPTVMQRKDGRMMITWSLIPSSTVTGNAHLYYTTTDGTLPTLPAAGIPAGSWTSAGQFFTDQTFSDERASLVQARDGTLFTFWQRFTTILGIYWISSADNGTTWTVPVSLHSSSVDEFDVAAAQMSDKTLWLFWNKVGSTGLEMWSTTSNPITGVHDVGLTSLSESSYFLRSNDAVNITVGVANYGDYAEGPTLTVQLRTATTITVVKSMPLSLAIGQKLLVQFNWNSSQPYYGFWGKYNLTATIQPVLLESPINQGDNYWLAGLMRVSPLGDLDRNGRVDIVDAARLAFAFGSTGPPLSPPSPLWDPEADINHSGRVDIVDAAVLAFYFGDSVL